MRKALIKIHNEAAGILTEEPQGKYIFQYDQGYAGPPISLTMPVEDGTFDYDTIPPFFDGVLPEGIQLEGLLKQYKIDRKDYFQQLLTTGLDLVGAVTIEEFNSNDE